MTINRPKTREERTTRKLWPRSNVRNQAKNTSIQIEARKPRRIQMKKMARKS